MQPVVGLCDPVEECLSEFHGGKLTGLQQLARFVNRQMV
jgi:hypothetical protein